MRHATFKTRKGEIGHTLLGFKRVSQTCVQPKRICQNTGMATLANPYAAQLGNRSAREVIAETPGRLQSILRELSPDGLERSYAPGKWTARQILCHLADCEIAFSFRLRQALAEPNHVIQPFDQDEWARLYGGVGRLRRVQSNSSARSGIGI